MRPVVVLVLGRPASGKTTLARLLGRALGAPVVAKDDLKELLFEALGSGDRAWSRRLGLAGFDLLDHVIDLQLAGGGPFLVESPFDAAIAGPRFAERAARFDVRWLQVRCTAPREVLLHRFAERAASGTRHPGHVDERNLEEFAASLEVPRQEVFDLPGPVIEVDTSLEAPATVVERVLAAIEGLG